MRIKYCRTKLKRLGAIALLAAMSFSQIAVAESDAALIEKAYIAWEKAANAKDIEIWSTYLAPDATFVPADAPPLETRQAILDYYLKSFADPHFSLDCEQLSIDVAESGEKAWSNRLCRATLSDELGNKANGVSRWFKIWLKQADGSWKCQLNAWSFLDIADE